MEADGEVGEIVQKGINIQIEKEKGKKDRKK